MSDLSDRSDISDFQNREKIVILFPGLVFVCGDLVEGEGPVEHLIAALAVGGVLPIEGEAQVSLQRRRAQANRDLATG